MIFHPCKLPKPRLADWAAKPSTSKKGDCSLYKSGLQPDSWCRTDPFTETPLLDYTPITLPKMDKLFSVYMSPGMLKVDKVDDIKD